MKSRQFGGMAMALLAIFTLVIVFIVTSYANSPATADEITTLATVSAKTPGAQDALKAFLATNPKPTKSEFLTLKSQLNELAVLDAAKKITGNQDIDKKEQMTNAERERETEDQDLYNLIFRMAAAIILLTGSLLLIKEFFRRRNS